MEILIQKKEYLKKMVDYNKGDIVTTEELYLTLQPYFGAVQNKAVKKTKSKSKLPEFKNPPASPKKEKVDFSNLGAMVTVIATSKSKHLTEGKEYTVTNAKAENFVKFGQAKLK